MRRRRRRRERKAMKISKKMSKSLVLKACAARPDHLLYTWFLWSILL